MRRSVFLESEEDEVVNQQILPIIPSGVSVVYIMPLYVVDLLTKEDGEVKSGMVQGSKQSSSHYKHKDGCKVAGNDICDSINGKEMEVLSNKKFERVDVYSVIVPSCWCQLFVMMLEYFIKSEKCQSSFTQSFFLFVCQSLIFSVCQNGSTKNNSVGMRSTRKWILPCEPKGR